MNYNLGELVYKITGDSSSLQSSIGKSEGMMKGFATKLKNMAGTFALAFGIKASIQAAAAYEQQEVAFTTMLGSAERAKDLMKEVVDFAASTPFQLPGLTEATKKLIAFGVPAEKSIETLRTVGDVAAGLGIPIGELAELYGKAKTQMTLYGEDINQLAGRGIPIFEELAKVTGKNVTQIKKLASQGKIGFKDLERVFENLTQKGGMFAGGMEAQSKTLNGQLSTLKDNVEGISRGLGKMLIPVVKTFTGELNKSITAITEYMEILDKLKETNKRAGEAKEIFLQLKQAAKEAGGSVQEFVKYYSDINNISAEGFFKYSEMISRYYKLTGGIGKNLKKTASQTKSMTTQEIAGLKTAFEKVHQMNLEYNQKVMTANDDKLGIINQQEYEAWQELKALAGVNQTELEELKLRIAEYYAGKRKDVEEDALKKQMRVANEHLQRVSQLWGQVGSIANQYYTNMSISIDNERYQRENALESWYNEQKTVIDNSVLGEKSRAKKLEALDQEKARRADKLRKDIEKKTRKAQHDAAVYTKGIAIIQSIINTALGVTQALATVPWPFSMYVAGAIGFLGATQTMLIAAQPIPAMAAGGIAPGGRVLVGEQGPEIVDLPSGSRVRTASETASMLQPLHVIVNLGSKVLYDDIRYATENGELFIDARSVI